MGAAPHPGSVARGDPYAPRAPHAKSARHATEPGRPLRELARRYLAEGILNFNMLADAQHIAMATVAAVDAEKLRDYLLSHEHPHGRFKARFFNALGFRADQWQELEAARIQH